MTAHCQLSNQLAPRPGPARRESPPRIARRHFGKGRGIQSLLHIPRPGSLEEAIRREARLGGLPALSASCSARVGRTRNHASISREAGVPQPVIKNHYQVLEDMLVGFRVPAWSKSPRKGVPSTPRFFLFDVGVRHAAAGLEPSRVTVEANPGPIFEQWGGIELWKRLQHRGGTSGKGALHTCAPRTAPRSTTSSDTGTTSCPWKGSGPSARRRAIVDT
ncbi:MAG TPA: DUF4143 domain-containing protein [Planctomycetota bacterium]|nr:DUF4143 domain-containing protein [Planctomycetota bacterium]